MAAAAAQVGGRLLCKEMSPTSQQQAISRGNGRVNGSCVKSSVSLACKLNTIAAENRFSSSTHCNYAPRLAVAASASASDSVSPSNSRRVRAVAEKAVETVDPVSSTSAQKTRYHFVVANAKFMLDDEEHFQELMRERRRHFGEVKKEQDFWLVIEPDFLSNFPDIEKRLGRPAVALVSTDSTWITFMKLRLDRVLKGTFEADSLAQALAGGNSSTELNFEKPGKWTAPYPKYEGDWWTPFLPPQ